MGPMALQRATYRPRHAEHTVLHAVIREHLEPFLQAVSDQGDGSGLPRFVAALMRRVLDLDVLACPRCGGRLRLIASVQDPLAVQAILTRLARSAAPAPPGPAPPAPATITLPAAHPPLCRRAAPLAGPRGRTSARALPAP